MIVNCIRTIVLSFKAVNYSPRSSNVNFSNSKISIIIYCYSQIIVPFQGSIIVRLSIINKVDNNLILSRYSLRCHGIGIRVIRSNGERHKILRSIASKDYVLISVCSIQTNCSSSCRFCCILADKFKTVNLRQITNISSIQLCKR